MPEKLMHKIVEAIFCGQSVENASSILHHTGQMDGMDFYQQRNIEEMIEAIMTQLGTQYIFDWQKGWVRV